MSVQCKPSYTPLLYSKPEVYRGTHFFLVFALGRGLWVLVRTAGSSVYQRFCVVGKDGENSTIFHLKILDFAAVKNCCILHGRVFRNALMKSVFFLSFFSDPLLYIHS